MTGVFATQSNIQAKQAAYAAVEQLKPQATSLVEYQSRGHVVIIADSKTLELVGDLPKPLTSEVIQYEGRAPNKEITIDGALGQFIVNVGDQAIKADLILDYDDECSDNPPISGSCTNRKYVASMNMSFRI